MTLPPSARRHGSAEHRAFWFVCQLLENVRNTLPEELVCLAAGETDLCNERSLNYEQWKAPRYNIGQSLASVDPAEEHKTLVFWLDELLADHIHQCRQHLLDGACLWEQLSTSFNNYMFNVLWSMTMTVAAWLRNVSRSNRSRLILSFVSATLGSIGRVLQSHVAFCLFDRFPVAELEVQAQIALDLGRRSEG